MERCQWALASPLEQDYHDHEWGLPLHDDHRLFEFLTLEGAQAGLSWATILKKRDGYRQAFDQFDPEMIANYSQKKIASLLSDPSIIRNRLKIRSVVTNARAFLDIQSRFGSFDTYVWQFVDGVPIQNNWKATNEIPAYTSKSKVMSNVMKSDGFKFVGPTICYAFMQATGMVNDHTTNCYRYEQLKTI